MKYVKDDQTILYILYTCDELYQHKIREHMSLNKREMNDYIKSFIKQDPTIYGLTKNDVKSNEDFVEAVDYHELQFLSLDQIMLNLSTGEIEEY